MKIAIFSGLSFHFEMFGYIIHLCKTNGHHLTIYSPPCSHGWNEFYKQLYSRLELKAVGHFFSDYNTIDYIFLITDDDRNFPESLTTKKNIICIDHNYIIRRPSIDLKYHIGTRPFSTNYRKWALPCYPIVMTTSEKRDSIVKLDNVDIVILGGRNDYEVKHINRLSSTSNIRLHIISRIVDPRLLSSLDQRFTLCIHENISTSEMIKILKESKYVLCDITSNLDHITGKSMSGSIPLAFSNLNKLILSKENNSLYKFKTAQTFDLNSSEPIEVSSKLSQMEIQNIFNERNSLIKEFHNHMNTLLR